MGVVILVRGLLNWLYLKYELIELTVFSHGGTNSHKVKGDLKIFGLSMVKKMGVTNLVMGL